jgi:hypothetical protein
MKQYIHVRPNGLMIEFSGDLNQVAAQREAEKQFGPGRIFREIGEAISPWENQPPADSGIQKKHSGKIPVLHK